MKIKMMIMMVVLMMMMMMIMTILGVEQRPGWGVHVLIILFLNGLTWVYHARFSGCPSYREHCHCPSDT